MEFESPYLEMLKDRLDLREIPFTDRGSRLLVYRENEHFLIRLAERWFKRTGQLAAYRHRPPLVEDFSFTGEDGSPLEFSLTTYPHRLDCRTSSGQFTITFLNQETLLITLPAGRFGIRFLANVDQGKNDRRGGVLRTTGEIRRSLAYTTNARLLQNTIEPGEDGRLVIKMQFEPASGEALLINITPRLGFNRYIPDPATALLDSARRWHEWFDLAPKVAEPFQTQYYFAWWVMRAGLISTRFYTTREAMTPSKFYYLGVWQWDAYFHAIGYRHVSPELAKDQLRVLLDHQREDGMLPDAVHDEGVVTHLDFPVEADVTKPPLVAWAAWKLYEVDHDKEFLDEVYEPLVLWNNWWFEKNDLDHNGLCEYQHPFSSGLDDSPLWDQGMPVESPDLNTYLCLQLDCLAKIADVIGESEAARSWERAAEAHAARMLDSMWDERAGLFWAKRDGQRVDVRTPFNLFPLITGRMPARVAQRLVDHLMNEGEFWPRYPVPSVALDDPKFDPHQMWRGPTWINVNYLLIEGLQRSGYVSQATELRRRTLEMICNLPDIYEYYHPLTGAQPPKAAPIFGWSSAILIDLAIQATRELNSGDGLRAKAK
jgi:glycogen debranching enzyme